MSEEINEMTVKEAKNEINVSRARYFELCELFGAEAETVNVNKSAAHPFKVGEKYLIRTVTMIQLGRLVNVFDNELELEGTCWVADTGRFHVALEKGLDLVGSSEIEMFKGNVIVGRGAIIDACVYNHKLPSISK